MGVELLVTAAVGCLTAADLAANVPGSREDDWLSWTLLAVSVLGLLAHRRRPLLSAGVTGAASLGWTVHGHLGELLNLPVMVALYWVAVRGDRRRTLRVGVAGALLSGAAAVVAGHEQGRPVPSPVLEMAIPLVPLLLGEVVRGRQELTRRAAEEHARETARRLREERVLLARELHDVIAHTVSAMTVQAGVALDAFDRRPEVARAALRQVRDSGKEAVRELRTTVAFLREDGAAAPVVPAPTLAHLPDLVERVPLPVALRCSPGPPPLPPLVELTAYRVVQEALTNVVKHSAARHAAVSVRAAPGRLLVEVTDDGPPVARPGRAAGGFGLLGMRERVSAAGGTLEHGPLPAGGYRVLALLPLGDGARPTEDGHRPAENDARPGRDG
ncbi:sensor histidine kinase [Streptomyces marincola]|uniref:sensor histidine kinase n=1 Tax=Streptomyces marincola TaxID=2878388 RepID=UPI001CF565F0|nr:sensor histidine kinase [Streptomyces marincola]UCM89462.1 sensor histidine kinase [Streptomyces marincola]